jgi:hypothetical protein
MLSGIADVEAQEKFGVCLVSITREHEREYRELERLKRNLLREREWCKFADSANFLANLKILRVNEFVSPLRHQTTDQDTAYTRGFLIFAGLFARLLIYTV